MGRPIDNECAGSQSAKDKRAENRTATVFRPVLIETVGFAGFCLVRNISANGMMGQVYTDFARGTEITVQFSPTIIIGGVVAWSANDQIGIEFDEAIEVDALLVELGRKTFDGKPSRPPRLEMQKNGFLKFDGRDIEFQMKDISQSGVKVRASYIKPGDTVDVILDGLSLRRAKVCWMQNGIAGLNFLRPLSFEELASWVTGQNAKLSGNENGSSKEVLLTN